MAVRATQYRCAACRDYEFIDDGHGMLTPCPDCAKGLVRCPVHGQKVMVRAGVLVGRCWDCTREAADAIARIQRRT